MLAGVDHRGATKSSGLLGGVLWLKVHCGASLGQLKVVVGYYRRKSFGVYLELNRNENLTVGKSGFVFLVCIRASSSSEGYLLRSVFIMAEEHRKTSWHAHVRCDGLVCILLSEAVALMGHKRE